MNSLASLLRSRRSVRRFSDRVPDRALISELIMLAATAPSASNQQPWRFTVVQDPQRITQLAQAVRDEVAGLVARAEPEARDSVAAYAEHFSSFASAPTVIAVASRPRALMASLLRPTGAAELGATELEATGALLGTGIAVGYLLLAAHAQGLGACCLTGPLIARHALQRQLELRPGWQLSCLLAVGYAQEAPAPTRRKPLHLISRWI